MIAGLLIAASPAAAADLPPLRSTAAPFFTCDVAISLDCVLPTVTVASPFEYEREKGGNSMTAMGTTLPATSSGPETSLPEGESPFQSSVAMRVAFVSYV